MTFEIVAAFCFYAVIDGNLAHRCVFYEPEEKQVFHDLIACRKQSSAIYRAVQSQGGGAQVVCTIRIAEARE